MQAQEGLPFGAVRWLPGERSGLEFDADPGAVLLDDRGRTGDEVFGINHDRDLAGHAADLGEDLVLRLEADRVQVGAQEVAGDDGSRWCRIRRCARLQRGTARWRGPRGGAAPVVFLGEYMAAPGQQLSEQIRSSAEIMRSPRCRHSRLRRDKKRLVHHHEIAAFCRYPEEGS
jgi:hypothetical protein